MVACVDARLVEQGLAPPVCRVVAGLFFVDCLARPGPSIGLHAPRAPSDLAPRLGKVELLRLGNRRRQQPRPQPHQQPLQQQQIEAYRCARRRVLGILCRPPRGIDARPEAEAPRRSNQGRTSAAQTPCCELSRRRRLRRQRQQPCLPQWRCETRRCTRGVQTDRRLWPGEELDEELSRNDGAHRLCQPLLDQTRVHTRRRVLFILKFVDGCSPRRQ